MLKLFKFNVGNNSPKNWVDNKLGPTVCKTLSKFELLGLNLRFVSRLSTKDFKALFPSVNVNVDFKFERTSFIGVYYE